MSEKLERTLSFPVMLVITVNAILGSGIFFLPVVGARVSGPASLIAWVILSLSALYMAAIFAELTSMFPEAGGVYEFCKQAYGRFVSFIVGWVAVISGNVTIAMLIVGAIMYLLPGTGYLAVAGLILPVNVVRMLISIFFILAFNYIAYRGMETSSTMLVTFGVITIGSILAFMVPGILNFHTGSIVNHFADSLGFSQIFLTLFLISETFFGLETATFLAGETKDGARVMPKVMLTATVINAGLIFVFVVMFLGNISFDQLATGLHLIPYTTFMTTQTPIAELTKVLYGSGAVDFFNLLVYLVILGSVAGWIVSAPRLLLAMAEDKLFLSQIGKVHPRYKTPYIAILFQTIVTIGLIVFASSSDQAYNTLLEMLTPMALVMYALVAGSLLLLRKAAPERKRYYTAPFAKVGVPLIILLYAVLIGVWLFTETGAVPLFRLILSFIAFGIPLYLLIEVYYDPKMITSINDIFAYFAVFTERITLPLWVRRHFLLLLGPIKDKTVLEYGCNVGTLTVDLARSVGPYGTLYATDISVRDLEITQQRIQRHLRRSKGLLARVQTLHDEHHFERIHPAIPYADVVVSVGMLSYIQDVDKVLSDIYDILPYGGRITLLEFGDFFRLIPNVEWLSSNDVIMRRFKKVGFLVRVDRKRGLFWNYIFVYGMKSREEVPYI